MRPHCGAGAEPGNALSEAILLLPKLIELLEQAGFDVAAAHAQMALDSLDHEAFDSD